METLWRLCAKDRIISNLSTQVRYGLILSVAPAVGFEPTTVRLTVGCSAVELRGIAKNSLGRSMKPGQILRSAKSLTMQTCGSERRGILAD